MSKKQNPRSTSDKFHIVISTKELQDINELEAYYISLKYVDQYIITVEYGSNGHAHLDSFVILNSLKRQDKVRDHLIKSLYEHVPDMELRNIRVVVNHIDPDPRYAIGYAMKEDPKVVKTNIDKETIHASVDYYYFNKDKVDKMKSTMDKSFKPMTVDDVCNAYLSYCESVGEDLYINSKPLDANLYNREINKKMTFRSFYIQLGKFIPYSVYARLNHTTLLDWVEMNLAEKGTAP